MTNKLVYLWSATREALCAQSCTEGKYRLSFMLGTAEWMSLVCDEYEKEEGEVPSMVQEIADHFTEFLNKGIGPDFDENKFGLVVDLLWKFTKFVQCAEGKSKEVK